MEKNKFESMPTNILGKLEQISLDAQIAALKQYIESVKDQDVASNTDEAEGVLLRLIVSRNSIK